MIAHVKKLDRALEAFTNALLDGMGRPERRRAMAWYIEGLLLDGARKSIEPMAARLVDEPAEVEAMRQRLQQCVSVSAWSDDEFRARLAREVEAELPAIEALVLDDTGFPKQGRLSVGVARQYSGTLGRTANCQVGVSLHLAGELGSACLGMRLYLPEEWTRDRERCRKAGVPDDVGFQRKWEIALALLDDAVRWGVDKRLLLVDAGYGEITEFRESIAERGYPYIVGMGGDPVVWSPGTAPVAPSEWRRPSGQRGPTRTRFRDGKHSPVSLLDLATALGRKACRSVRWREGAKGTQHSRFNAVRVRTAHKHTQGRAPGPEEWLLYEWPADEKEPTKFWLSNLPANTSLKDLVRLAKLRWRVERDYQELKEEIGLDHFEGRSWRGFHHHVTLCAAAHAFLALNRALFPPQGKAMDTPDGAPPASARTAPQDRVVPAVPPAHRRVDAAARAVEDVIE
jgi:SRSO17 transposase